MLAPIWGVALYCAYFPRMYPHARPADFAEHLKCVRAMLKQPGRLRALRLLFSESSGATYRRHADIHTPALIVMGARDPDFGNPELEARTLAARLPQATVKLLPGTGHHPHVEVPQVVGPAIIAFLAHQTSHPPVAGTEVS